MNALITSLKAAADPVRLRILLLLSEEEACVCELMGVFRMPQSKLSHHLIILRDAGLLSDSRRGKWNYYRLRTPGGVGAVEELVASLRRWLEDDATIKSDHKKLLEVKRKLNICCPVPFLNAAGGTVLKETTR